MWDQSGNFLLRCWPSITGELQSPPVVRSNLGKCHPLKCLSSSRKPFTLGLRLFALQSHLLLLYHLGDPELCSPPPTHRYTTSIHMTGCILWTQHALRMSRPAYFTSEIKLNLTAGLTSCYSRCSLRVWPVNSLQVTMLSRTPHSPILLQWTSCCHSVVLL